MIDLHLRPLKTARYLALLGVLILWAAFPGFVIAQASYNLVIHNIQAVPIEGQAAYDVGVYFSVLDEDGNPVNDLEADDFSISEDSKAYEIDRLDLVHAETNHIILVMDASGSMVGDNMDAAIDAASQFVQALERDDRIAVLSFTRETRTEINFTDNREDARNAIEAIEAERNSDTCLYDAAYEAVQKLALEPAGRRAVILLTDGVDETYNGGGCSIHTIDDVTDLATTGKTRTPIYTIGLTDRSDERNLERMSMLTGGRYRLSVDRTTLEDTFDELTEQFRSEYVLHYTSTSASGSYQLLLEVDHRDRRDQDTRDFELPELPVSIFITAPAAGAELDGLFTIEANATGLNQIKEVIFRINDTDIGAASNAPYRLDYDFSLLVPGEYTLAVRAQDFNNTEIAQQSISILVSGAAQPADTQSEEIKPTDIPLATTAPQSGGMSMPRNSVLLIGLGVLGLLAVVIVVALIFIFMGRRRKSAEEDITPPQQPVDDRTIDSYPRQPPAAHFGIQPRSGPLALLRILASEDPMMVGQSINLVKNCTTIGRGADNDLVLPLDKAVSRQHAMIEMTATDFYLSEYITQEPGGGVKRPTYGTFVNGEKVGTMPVQLNPGDEIQLGTRFKLLFEKIGVVSAARLGSDKTLDDPNRDDDKTLIM